ncbi:MAG: hypothetical protein CMP56_04990 [Flavobacteriales bacterium]|nr:hypothetical protein [Flavobacteriales bacterium]
MMLRVLVCVLFLSNVGIIFSQVQGFVVDVDNAPLSDVEVFFVDQNLVMKTNEKGLFTIDNNLPENSYLELYKFGYNSSVAQYRSGQDLIVVLQKMHVELDEIGIQENVSFLGSYKHLNIEKKSLNNNFIASTSLVENLNELSGVNSIGSGLGIQKVVVRGLSGLRVATYLNGMRIANQEWANDHSIGFTDLGLGRIELIKGASSLKFGGDAVGGVLYFQDEPFTKVNRPTGFLASKFDNSHFLFSNQFGFKLSKQNLYFNLYGEHTAASDYRLPDKNYLFNSRFQNQALKFSFARLGEKLQFIARYQYNNDEVGIPAHDCDGLNLITIEEITSSSLDLSEDYEMTRPTQYIVNHLFNFETKYFTSKIKYSFFAGYFINNLQEFEKWTIPAFDMDLSTTNLRLNLDFEVGELSVNTGVQYNRQENLNNIKSRLIPDSYSNDMGVYTTIDFEKNNFGFNTGVRLDYKEIVCNDYNYNELFNAFNSSVGVFYKKNDHLTRLTYSGSYRAPHLSELFSNGLHHGTNRYEVCDSNLDIEHSHQFDFKYQWNDEHFGFVVNPFIQLITDFIAINPIDSFYLDRYRIYNYVQYDEVHISGVELNVHYHPHFLHNLHIEQSYSFINTLNKANDSNLFFTPANKIKSKLNFDLDIYNLPFGLKKVSLYHLYAFAQNNIVSFESASDSYSILNAELLFNPLINLSLVVGVKNIFNKEYIPHLSRIKEVAGGVPEPGRSFHVSLKYDF